MKILLGTIAFNAHIQNIALALYEGGILGSFYSGGVDNFRSPLMKTLRPLLSRISSGLDSSLKRRRVDSIPPEYVCSNWRWEGPRTLASKMGLDERLVDWLWEKSELSLDRKCASAIKGDNFDAVFGVEHGALGMIEAARQEGKKSAVAFLSPHRCFREKFVDVEYARFPSEFGGSSQKLIELSIERDERRDAEAQKADVIIANSRLTANSLIEAGHDPGKIINVPLGSPPAIEAADLEPLSQEPMKFVYAGSLIIHKGVHYLLEAWERLSPGNSAELHFFGAKSLPERFFDSAGDNVFFHGTVSQSTLLKEFQTSSALVFPTLCDGFGMVVMEAMANGLPVITTENAGASEFVVEGENGFLIPPADVGGIAEKIDWCIRNPEALSKMRPNAIKTAKGWTWNDFRKTLLEELITAWSSSDEARSS